MKKKILTTLMALTLLLTFTNAASAVDQKPNAEVFLGLFDVVAPGTKYSNYCTATQSHVNLRIDVTSGTAQAIAQYRAPNGSWTNMGTNTKTVSSSYTYNINAKTGYDYRLKIKASFLSAKGQVNCY
jgi:hypothetical protein